MKTKKPILVLLSLVILFASCTIEKRHYRPGYNVQWRTPLKLEKTVDVREEEKTLNRMGEVIAPEKAKVYEEKIHASELKTIAIKPEVAKPEQKKNFTQHETLLVKSEVQEKNFNAVNAVSVATVPQISKEIIEEHKRDPLGDSIRILFAIIFLILGIPPLAVIIVGGTGKEISTNLLLWLVGLVLVLIAVLALDASFGFIMIAGLVMLLLSYVHAVVLMIQSVVD